MAVQGVSREGDGGKDRVLHPWAQGAIDEGDEIFGTRRRIARGPREWRPHIDKSPREIIDIIAKRVTDSHDDTVGLGRVDGLPPLEVLGRSKPVGVAIGDVPMRFALVKEFVAKGEGLLAL